MLETDLYNPIKKYFEEQGFQVKGEIDNCDVVAVKEDSVIICELKLRLNIEVVLQAVQRQKLAKYVYVAVPQPPKSLVSQKKPEIISLFRRLCLGLITVSPDDKLNVKLELEAKQYDAVEGKRIKGRRLHLQKEFQQRTGDNNTGGSKGTKLITVYREKVLKIAALLEINGAMSAKELRKLGTDDKTYNILRSNYYGWFKKIDKGLYALSDKGYAEISDYYDLIETIMSKE